MLALRSEKKQKKITVSVSAELNFNGFNGSYSLDDTNSIQHSKRSLPLINYRFICRNTKDSSRILRIIRHSFAKFTQSMSSFPYASGSLKVKEREFSFWNIANIFKVP